MYSCSEILKACDTNCSNRIQPQRVSQQGIQYGQPQQRQNGQPVPNRVVQTAYAEQKAISAGIQPIEQNLEQVAEIPPPPPFTSPKIDTTIVVNPPFVAAQPMIQEKPPPEPKELGPAPNPPSYEWPEEKGQAGRPVDNNPLSVTPTPDQPQKLSNAPQGPDLKEPEPEETIEFNASWEFKKASIGSTITAVVVTALLALLFIQRDSYEGPDCPEPEFYKLNDTDAPKSCDPCGSGTIVIPLGGEWEQSWGAGEIGDPKPLRAILYFLGLGWCFLGIAIVCDQFMAAIEEITSKKRVVWLKVHGDTKHKFHKKVWNDTVANLTLMALGSSAPEILLSVIELMGNSFFAGELGPSTIVGSAAFNLLVITAVCVAAIPAPEIRKIEGLSVFAVTASLSVFAYVWLIVILKMTSEDVITKTEALLTFSFFPMMVILAFCADKGYLGRLSSSKVNGDTHVYEEQGRLERLYQKKISFETVKLMMDANGPPQIPQMTKAQYRRQMMKHVIGGSKEVSGSAVTCGFINQKYITLECAGALEVPVKISLPQDAKVEVRYYTQDGLALAGKRYEHVEGVMSFQPGETEKIISIPIMDNDVWEEQEDFSINLDNLNKQGEPANEYLGYGIRSTKVVILNDDEPGTLCFFVDEVKASRDASSIQVGVNRINGSTGRITCQYCTEDDTAVAGSNYTSTEGMLTFEEGVSKASIDIRIAPLGRSSVDRCFRVVLHNPSEGVKFDSERDGGTEQTFCDVILPGQRTNRSALASCFSCCMCDFKLTSSLPDWREQFTSAFYCNGSPADQSTCSKTDWCFHLLSQPFKVLFAFIPPAQIAGGWACFCLALGMIGAVTMIVGDMAALMGCCLGVPDDITAITIVALGTSLPDTFASKSAAMHDPNADNSIGNVTGSNCVNVFLGLGLPWTAGAFYWDSQGKTDDWKKKDFKDDNYEEKWGNVCPDGCFLVPAGALAFSVTVFTSVAVTCILLLIVRRRWYGGELGGPHFASRRDAAFLVSLWLVYVVMSILNSLKVIKQ
jgi:solute carrier family 8 (sodium/calcium exchanger)